MKAIRIFLLVLIIIGIILLCTQSLWVPKLVDYILAGEQTSTLSSSQAATSSESIEALPQIYVDSPDHFSIRYPNGYKVDQSYQYQELGPNESINGVKFTIPASIAAGTNLSPDTYVSVEYIPQTSSCTANLFLQAGVMAQTLTDKGITYSVASSTGAAAGNRYEETVYAIPGTNPCLAVRYFIHYGVIENYPPGAVQQFDESALLSKFDAIRRTLTLTK